MGRDDEYVKHIDEECNENIPLDNNNINQQNYQPGYFVSNVGAPYGMVYTQVQSQPQQPNLQYFNESSNNFSSYLLKDGQYIPVTNENTNSDNIPMMPPIVINQLTTYEDVDHTVPALLLFIFGFLFFIPWCFNIIYIRSKNRIARSLAIISVTLFSLSIFLFLVVILITVIAVETDLSSQSSSSDSTW